MKRFILTICLNLFSILGIAQTFDELLIKAQNGDPVSQNSLAICYFNGEGTVRDYHKAFEWHTRAAQNGIANSQYLLGVMYMTGTGCEKDPNKAEQWFCAGANHDDCNCLLMLGQIYYEAKQYNESYKNYIRSAELGNIEARYKLAEFYFEGIACQKDTLRAIENLYIASMKPNQCQGLALYDFAVVHECGLGVDKDLVYAKKCFEWSAQAGCVKALSALGDFYLLGKGVEKDIDTAIAYYRRATEQGYNQANHWIGNCHMIKGQEAEAIEVWNNPIGQLDHRSQFNIAEYYIDKDDYINAFIYYKKSADLGNPEAQYAVALFYLDGVEVKKDSVIALEYLSKSSLQGNQNAVTLMDELN